MDSGITIMFEPAEEGGYTAFMPQVPGAISQGETLDEVRDMVFEALNEISAYRHESALRSTGPKTLIDRVPAVF